MDELPEILAGIFKKLEKWELINEKLDKLPYMVKEVVSLRDEVNTVNEILSIHRGERSSYKPSEDTHWGETISMYLV